MSDGSLAGRIHEAYPSLPLKQQSVARILLDEPAAVALSSAGDLARLAGVDAATVVRTCQSLGYSGWRELLLQVKSDLAGQRTFAERVDALNTQGGDLISLIHENARRNVDETFQGLDHASLEATARVLSTAPSVMIVAGGASRGAGEYLASSLQVIGVRSTLVTGISDAATCLATLGHDDVVLAVSMWRYLKPTVEILQHAKQVLGTRTVVLTDSPVSSGTRFADHVLVARTSTVGPRLSMTGVISLAEAIVAKTALENPRRSQLAAGTASDFYLAGHVETDPVPDTASGRSASWAATLAKELADE